MKNSMMKLEHGEYLGIWIFEDLGLLFACLTAVMHYGWLEKEDFYFHFHECINAHFVKDIVCLHDPLKKALELLKLRW